MYIYIYISLSLGRQNSMSVPIRYQQLIRKVCSKVADEATSKQLNPISGGWGGGSTINHHPSMHGPGMKRPWRRMPTEMSGWWASIIQQLVMHLVWKPSWIQRFWFTFFLNLSWSSWSSSITFLGDFDFNCSFFCILRTRMMQISWQCALHGATLRWPMATSRPGTISCRYLAANQLSGN